MENTEGKEKKSKVYRYPEEIQRTLEHLPVPIGIYQFLNGKVQTVLLSDGLIAFNGLSREKLQEQADNDMFSDTPPEEAEMVAKAGYRFATEGGIYDVCYHEKTVTGRVRYVHAVGHHIYAPTGERLSIVYYDDIEEAVGNTQKARAEMEEPIGEFFRSNTSAMAVVGRDIHVLYYYNKALAELLPPKMSYDSGRTFNEFFFGSEKKGISGLFEQVDSGLRTVQLPGEDRRLQVSVLSTFWAGKPALLIYFYVMHEGDRDEIRQKEQERARIAFNNFLYSGAAENGNLNDERYKGYFIWNLSDGGRLYREDGNEALFEGQSPKLDYPEYRKLVQKLSKEGSEASDFADTASLEYFLNAFHSGSYPREELLTYPTPKGPVAMHSDISMMESPDTGDIFLKIQNRNMTNETYIDRLVRSAMQDFFDELIYIDGKFDVSYVVNSMSIDTPLQLQKGSVEEMLPLIASHIGQSLGSAEQLYRLIRNTCGNRKSGVLTYKMSNQKVKSIKMHILDADSDIYYISIEDVSEILNLENYQYYDRLTGLPNMTWFRIQSQMEMENMFHQGLRPVFLYFDLVGMRRFNDAYGYEQGDALLKESAEVIQSVFRDQPAARFYEDHFCVLTLPDELEEKLTKVRDRIAAYRKRLDESDAGTSIVRAGVYYAESEEEPVTRCCDHARLAAAQLHGQMHDFYRVYTDQISADEKEKAYILEHFEEALDKGWIKTYYQPIVSTGVGQAEGAPEKQPVDYEALSRWEDPVYGMISPGFFVPVLEEYRLVDQLDLYMIRNVGRDFQTLMHENPDRVPPSVSINLSRVDFNSDDIVDRVIQEVEGAGLPREHLHIEITESAMADDEANLHHLAAQLKKEGFAVWLDDFGTGYSSLKVLIDFDFDVLKLDMSLLKKLMVNKRSRLLVQHVLQMAKDLKIETLCEGVETEEQYNLLKEMGCGRIQGFLFGKPEPFSPDKKY
jgi:diguanylate cyclase (GGDEF)-like protein